MPGRLGQVAPGQGGVTRRAEPFAHAVRGVAGRPQTVGEFGEALHRQQRIVRRRACLFAADGHAVILPRARRRSRSGTVEPVKNGRSRTETPFLITGAAPSLDDQFDARRRKYLIMMGLRIVCVIAAVAVVPISLWLSLAFMVGGAVLPWCAVLIANDRPPKKGTAFVRYHAPNDQGQLGGGRDESHDHAA